MRQQYHIRQVAGETHVWDVFALLALARGLPVQQVALDGIAELQQAYWYPDSQPTTLDLIEHMRLVHAADLAYPIVLDADGKLMDGMHRVVKAVLAGQTHIAAVRLLVTPPPDCVNVDLDTLPYLDRVWDAV